MFDGLTRDDFRKSFDKMVGLVGRLHKAGVRIVAGTDGYGLELVRELELYQQAGLTNAEALQTATIVPARMTGMDDRTGSIAKGKTADMILVDGDVSKDLAQPAPCRRPCSSDGYRLDGEALREASGLTGMPKMSRRFSRELAEPRLTLAFRCLSSLKTYPPEPWLNESHLWGEFRVIRQIVEGHRLFSPDHAARHGRGAAGSDRQHLGNGEHAAGSRQHRRILAYPS